VAQFVSREFDQWYEAAQAEWARLGLPPQEEGWPRAPRPGEDPAAVPAWSGTEWWGRPEFGSWLRAHPKPVVTVAQVADQVEYARDVAGIDHVGLGGDFDGTVDLPEGLGDVSGYPRLMAELSGRGWSSDELAKLASGNLLRVLRESERLAEEPMWPRL
jgi:membrane dipeptidase